MKSDKDSAVSPVVGVMLMLVVTIIIAAVVSGFAGGLAGETKKAPQASLKCDPVIEAIQDTEADNGLLFEHMGGDSFALSDIYVQLQSGDAKITIGPDDTIQSSEGNCVSSDVTSYLMEVGDSDGFITPGDKFMLYADNCRIEDIYDSTYTNVIGQVKVISWKPEGAAGGFAAYFNTKCGYKIIDKASSKVIQTGTFVLI